MARPTKTGLDYFSFDCDFFDHKDVRRVLRAQGAAGTTVLICLLCNIYRYHGYYIEWNEDEAFEIADKIGVQESHVTETVNKAVQVGFFSKRIFDQYKVLTSYDIQQRYRAGTAKRSDVVIDDKYSITEPETGVTAPETPVTGVDSTQSKVKESIGKKSKVKSLVVDADDEPANEGMINIYNQLIETFPSKPTADDIKNVIWPKLKEYVITKNPKFHQPYIDLWNVFAGFYNLSKVVGMSDLRKKHLTVRLREKEFDYIKILDKIRNSSHLKGLNGSSWKCTFDFVIESQNNYLKILGGNYDGTH